MKKLIVLVVMVGFLTLSILPVFAAYKSSSPKPAMKPAATMKSTGTTAKSTTPHKGSKTVVAKAARGAKKDAKKMDKWTKRSFTKSHKHTAATAKPATAK